MKTDRDLLEQFERNLDPQNLNGSRIPATVIGFGEISTIFQIGGDDRIAYKRMPLFGDRTAAETYALQYRTYCRALEEAGLRLPADETVIVEVPGRPVVLYIAQQRMPSARFAHRLVHQFPDDTAGALLARIAENIERVWAYNRTRRPSGELAIDGQLSNWVWPAQDAQALYFVDTSTPLFRVDGREQLDPELLLQSAPGFLRWIVRLLFLEDVMNRYYDPRLVYVDLAANLYKEQRPDLIPLALEVFNARLEDGQALTPREIERYYREDKWIWRLFLAFRRVDRWLKTQLLRKRYEFILPGKIER